MQIAIGLFPGLTSLDAVGPYQVFSYLPGADVVVCAARPGIVVDEHGLLRFDVAATFDDVPAPAVLVIPGGQITHRMVRDRDPIIEWIRAAHPHTTYTTSVCIRRVAARRTGPPRWPARHHPLGVLRRAG